VGANGHSPLQESKASFKVLAPQLATSTNIPSCPRCKSTVVYPFENCHKPLSFNALIFNQQALIDKKWVRIDLMIVFWEISNTPHLPISPSPHLSTLPYGRPYATSLPPLPYSPTLNL
ncbi:hypothetical protein, partial [Hydrocoleum sp. CS-953]|uniref:hypothetical protein n=1 Tax=Hydrocoleum sp. CS-953 TaxID=1671698 RepID=UPI001AEF3F33